MQEELPDITVPFAVVTLLGSDLMRSTDPGVLLNKETLTVPARTPLLHVRCQVPTHTKRLFLFLGPFPKPGACPGSPDKNHPIK